MTIFPYVREGLSCRRCRQVNCAYTSHVRAVQKYGPAPDKLNQNLPGWCLGICFAHSSLDYGDAKLMLRATSVDLLYLFRTKA